MHGLRFFPPAGAVVCIVALAVAAQPGGKAAIEPKRVTLDGKGIDLKATAAALSAQTQIPIDLDRADAAKACALRVKGATFWEALEQAAKATGHRVTVGDRGKRIALVPRGESPVPVALDGPFRVAFREALARYDADTGLRRYEVVLDLSWEPRFPGFLIRPVPEAWKAIDDRGTVLAVDPGRGKEPVSGFAHPAQVRLGGLTRDARVVKSLEGEWVMLAADEVRTFQFALAQVPSPAQKKKATTAKLAEFKEYPDAWEVLVEVDAPDSAADLESFQQGLVEHKVALRSAAGGTRVEPDRYEAQTNGTKTSVRVGFPRDRDGKRLLADATKWLAVVESPVPREVTVRFQLADIPLP